ncbi:hypothetical protein K474DRAFT_438548 [Panus rudis PR-1116 ss-1]|nr:hypothetical protein K474DRAFT_438548 [Panus rudis PR-1116 ss-1]
MSPRRTSPSSSNSRSASPYSPQATRDTTKPKSKKREQFSACGACRMRRVRCDLKDLPVSASGHHPPCSNCKERGLKCVDEFAEVKAVKLLRRGRRLQQVEAVYGKTSADDSSLHAVIPPPTVIPKIRPEFFNSSFFRRFHIQRPILEPVEYRERFSDFINGNPAALSSPAQMISMALVVWAASFGVDEYGREDISENSTDLHQRMETVKEMLQELLYLIDLHGILRKPSWDGVRLLLLVLPLAQEIQAPIDRLVMHEAVLSQVQALCTLAPSLVDTRQGEFIDAAVRARVYFYGHTLDGITSGLRGGRLLLDEDDLLTFKSTLPTRRDSSQAFAIYSIAYRYAAVPLRISDVCREIHTALTGPKARRNEVVNEGTLVYVWNTLDLCWKELEDLRQLVTGDVLDPEDVERYINGWQIFIFECHNVIREALKQRLAPRDSFGPIPGAVRNDVYRLYESARTRCHSVVRSVVGIISRNLGTSFFQFDAALVRDGCFFAGFLLAGELGTQSDVDVCLQALGEMRWVFSKSEERMHTVRMVWESRVARTRAQGHSDPSSPIRDPLDHASTEAFSYTRGEPSRNSLGIPPLTVLTLPSLSGIPSSGPNTGYSEDGKWSSTLSGGSRTTSHHGSISSPHDSPPLSGSGSYISSPPIPSGLKNSLDSPASVMLVGPAQHPITFGRSADVSDSYLYTHYDYSPYGEQSGSSRSHAPNGVDDPSGGASTSPSFHASHYLSETTAFTDTADASGDSFTTTPSENRNDSTYVANFYT